MDSQPDDGRGSAPVRIADRTWWVGQYREGDPFQCHAYLIEQGRDSVLLDPGSMLTFAATRAKVEQVVPFDHIRYFVCHHGDPDITAALPAIDALVRRDDAVIVTHWRAQELIKHYGVRMPFWRVEEHGWRLPLADRELAFVFTPYLHFPGTFCTHDPTTRVLFSSDLFGGFTDPWTLYARDEDYFEQIRLFHEHYMPSTEILRSGLERLQQLPIATIAPQHGSIVPGPLVGTMFARLKHIDCGIYLYDDEATTIRRLAEAGRALRKLRAALVDQRDFAQTARELQAIAGEVLPVDGIEFVAPIEGGVLAFRADSRYRGVRAGAPPALLTLLGGSGAPRATVLDEPGRRRLAVPLAARDGRTVLGVALFDIGAAVEIDAAVEAFAARMAEPLGAALERAVILRKLDLERQAHYDRSIRDPLTGLYNRYYLQEVVGHEFALADRGPGNRVAVALFDLDNFKRINDSYGHGAGDAVLRAFARVLEGGVRQGDIPVRMGGEEFAIVYRGLDVSDAHQYAERLRERFAGSAIDALPDGARVTVSAGVAVRERGEDWDGLYRRADAALYAAKAGGRDRVCVAPAGGRS